MANVIDSKRQLRCHDNRSTVLEMATDEEKSKVAKLLQDLEVPELKLPERCSGIVKEIEQKFGSELEVEVLEEQIYENPYIVNKKSLDENEMKLKELLMENKR